MRQQKGNKEEAVHMYTEYSQVDNKVSLCGLANNLALVLDAAAFYLPLIIDKSQVRPVTSKD